MASSVSQPAVGRLGVRQAAAQRSKLHYRWYVPYLFLLPGLALYALWMLYPLLYEFYISFFEWNILPGQTSTFIGLQNYQRALQDPVFWLTLGNTALYTVVTVIGQMIFGMAVAVMVHRVAVGKKFFRAIYYLPVVSSWVVVSYLFSFLFSSEAGGLINWLIGPSALGLVDKPVAWFNSAATAWVAIYTLAIWKGIGWSMVIFLAALQGIPLELYEAAAIDGAGGWRQFTRVTLPLIRRTVLFVAVMLVIGGFQAFLSIYLMTGGGPLNRTEVVLGYMYKSAFRDLDFGYGAALSYILAAIIVIANFTQMRLFNRGED